MKTNFENKAINLIHEVRNSKGELLCTVDFSDVVATLEKFGLLIDNESSKNDNEQSGHRTDKIL